MFFVLFILNGIHGFKVSGSCEMGHFYEPSVMDCLPCPANASLVTSTDGFGCSCKDHSVPRGILKCEPCNITEVVSSDGSSCVPRRCQNSGGRIVCRKCPNDYISVTQNFDGSPMKEVQCVKCARGYKALNNRCVRCEACACNKYEIVIKGSCVPKKYILERPKYSENILHPDEVLEFIKLEYLCTKQDYRACRRLASVCVRNHYTSHPAGPCRLWLQRNMTTFKGELELTLKPLINIILTTVIYVIAFPLLTTDDFKSNRADLSLYLIMHTLDISLARHKYDGGFEIYRNVDKFFQKCLPPLKIKIGSDFRYDCVSNVSELLAADYKDIFEIYILSKENIKSLPIVVRKPNGYYLERGSWTSNRFRKFFLINKFLSTTTNASSTVYLRNVLLRVGVERDIYREGSLKLQLIVEIQYVYKTSLSDTITTSLRVEHIMPDAGVMRSLEISGGVLSTIVVVYGVIQWRGAVRRGAHYFIIMPLLCGYVADALYFATFFSTLHALCSEAGTLSFTLPLSEDEEHLVRAMAYAVVTIKFIKVLWVNWKQCRCDIIFIDWTQYNTSVPAPAIKENNWRIDMLASELISVQTKRRVPTSYTVTMTVLVLYLINQFQTHLPKSQGYSWAIAASVWWSSYCALLIVFILTDKILQSNASRLNKLCTNLEISLLVFEEEYYGHYVNGRCDDFYTRSISHTLACCRLICSPQLRNAFVKLQTSNDFDDRTKHVLLSQFLGAFFERALDGLNWIASERTILERLLDVELTEREGGNTSVLLYDSNVTMPSLFAVAWMGEEWTLATFDAMVFGCTLISSDQCLFAALVTIIVWGINKYTRMLFSYWIIKNKT